MGFWSTSTQVARFAVDKLELSDLKEQLTAFSFQDIEETAEELSFGWTSIDDMDDTAFERSPVERGALHGWSLRIDARKIKPAVLSRLVKKRIAEESEREGRALSKDRRQEIKDQTKLHLLTKTPPEPRVVDLVHDPQQGLLYVFSNNKFALETVSELFEKTFGTELERLTPAWLARRLAGQKRAEEVFEAGIDAFDVPLPPNVPALFLAHLLKTAAAGESVNGVHLETGGKVALEKLVGEGMEKCTVSGWQGDPMGELLIAMADAKRISAATLILNDESTQESWTTGVTAVFETTVKTPKVDVQDKEDADGLFLEKFFLIERFFQMWDGLYRAFLTTWTPALESEIMVWAQSIAPGRQEETPGPLDSN